MEVLKKHMWKVLVVVGILCIVIAGIMTWTRITAPSAETPTDVESADSSEMSNDKKTFVLPEI